MPPSVTTRLESNKSLGTLRIRSRADGTARRQVRLGQGLSVMKIAHYCLPVLLLLSSSGCVTVVDCIDTCVIDCRNRCYAERAWWGCRSNYNEVECKCDFGKGFRDGYVA